MLDHNQNFVNIMAPPHAKVEFDVYWCFIVSMAVVFLLVVYVGTDSDMYLSHGVAMTLI